MTALDPAAALSHIRRCLPRGRRTHATLVLVSGGVGAGKTTLLRSVIDEAVDSGAIALSATGSEAERDLPFGVAQQLLTHPDLPSQLAACTAIVDSAAPFSLHPTAGDPAWDVTTNPVLNPVMNSALTSPTGHALSGRTPPPLAVPLPSAAGGVGGGTDAATPPLLHVLCAALLELSRHRDVVIVVDDAQFTDAPSLDAILAIQRRLAARRLLLVLSGERWRDLARPTFLPEATRLPHERIFLAPMSREQIAVMLKSDGAMVDSSEQAARVHKLSGGNPMIARALIDDDEWRAHFTGPDDAGSPVGPIFRAAVLSALRRCRPEAFDIARGIALLGPDASVASLARLLNVGKAHVVDRLRALERAGLVAGVEFRHPATAALVLSASAAVDLPPDAHALPAVDILTRLCGEPASALVGSSSRNVITGDWASRVLVDAVAGEAQPLARSEEVPSTAGAHGGGGSGSEDDFPDDSYVSGDGRPAAGYRRAEGPSSHVCGLLLRALATVDPAQRHDCLKELVVHVLAEGARHELTLTPSELWQGWLQEALAVEQTCGADRIEGEEDSLDAEPAVSLSDAERRVAELAASGLTNREIGRRLWITISTVEQHLTRVYRKLGVAGRTGIGPAYEAYVASAGLGADDSCDGQQGD